MQFRYWTVRIVPSPLAITSLGYGVIVQCVSTGESEWQFLDDHSRMGTVQGAVKIARKNLEAQLKRLQDTNHALDIAGTETLNDYLGWCVDHWNNLVRVDAAKFLHAASLAEACALLFSQLIEPPARNQPANDVRSLRATIKKAYQNQPLVRTAIKTDSTLIIAKYQLNPNCAVVKEDTVLELNEAFNFATANPNAGFGNVEAWSLKIEKMRNTSSQLEFANSRVEIDNDTDIVAFYYEPQSNRQSDTLKRAQEIWDASRVQYLPIDAVESRATELSKRLAA
ncbi:DUF3037 domain-containing protein [Corynebacterium propinquum]|nr:DUF3037 domain-containing protein [Corynebacterium propinquum]MDK4252195.1 DUF3037 domain-containing protein [Corynebacterium propinquum]